MSKIKISDLAINRDDESLADELTEQEINDILGGVKVLLTLTIEL